MVNCFVGFLLRYHGLLCTIGSSIFLHFAIYNDTLFLELYTLHNTVERRVILILKRIVVPSRAILPVYGIQASGAYTIPFQHLKRFLDKLFIPQAIAFMSLLNFTLRCGQYRSALGALVCYTQSIAEPCGSSEFVDTLNSFVS